MQSSDLDPAPVNIDLPLSLKALAAAAEASAQAALAAAQAAKASKPGAAKAAPKAGGPGAAAAKGGKGPAAAEVPATTSAAEATAGPAGPPPALAADVRQVLAQSREDVQQLAAKYYAAKDPARAIRCAALTWLLMKAPLGAHAGSGSASQLAEVLAGWLADGGGHLPACRLELMLPRSCEGNRQPCSWWRPDTPACPCTQVPGAHPRRGL